MSTKENLSRDTEIALIKSDLAYIKDDVAETKSKVDGIDKAVTKITLGLFNNPDTNEKGIIELSRKNASDVVGLKKWRAALLFLLAAVSTFFGWLGRGLQM